MKLAQGIVCGAWALAFPYEWARQIVDEFQYSAVPKAPPWLVGSTNIDGNIIPVLDMADFLGVSNLQSNPTQRLLIGGLTAGQSEDAIALLFTGLPQQIKYESQSLSYASALPARLRELCIGIARDATGRDYLEIDPAVLMAALSDELALV